MAERPIAFNQKGVRRIIKAVERVEGIDLPLPKKKVRSPGGRGEETVYLEITGTKTMRGAYSAELGTLNGVTLDTSSGDFDLTDFYTFGGDTVTFINEEEEGLNQVHALSAGDRVKGRLWGTADDGQTVYIGIPTAMNIC